MCDDTQPLRLRLKLGEALRMSVAKCGDLLPPAAKRLVPSLLRGAAPRCPYVPCVARRAAHTPLRRLGLCVSSV